MKITELRVGNWIKSKPKGNWYEWQVMPSDFELIFSNKEEDYQGIPITEEWLLKFGFKKCLEEWIYEDGSPGKSISFCKEQIKIQGDLSQRFVIWYSIDKSLKAVYLEYVHQLQNLYFALTGNEL